MKKKKFMTMILAMAMAVAMCFSAFAGQWLSDASGWWWQNSDGSWPANTWMWIDGNNDGIAECYYFNENGYCLMNTTTPDGYQVNATGAWVENGIIQQKEAVTDTTSASSSSSGSSSSSSASSSSSHSSSSSGSSRSAEAVNLTDLTPVDTRYYSVVSNVKTNQDLLWGSAIRLYCNGSFAEFYTAGKYSELTFTMAPAQGFNSKVEYVLEVYGDDDDLLWISDEINYKSKPVDVVVDVSGQEYVKLYLNKLEGTNNPYVYFKNAQFR